MKKLRHFFGRLTMVYNKPLPRIDKVLALVLIHGLRKAQYEVLRSP